MAVFWVVLNFAMAALNFYVSNGFDSNMWAGVFNVFIAGFIWGSDW